MGLALPEIFRTYWEFRDSQSHSLHCPIGSEHARVQTHIHMNENNVFDIKKPVKEISWHDAGVVTWLPVSTDKPSQGNELSIPLR